MMRREDWYPRLVTWKHWEVQKPSRESVAGFFIVLAASLLLHTVVLVICRVFKGS
ncbi:MAG TPA: hypothetical protein VFQ91_11270 [Bryobacteraceae bacterium]|nr:hypothetical protein [Bryobacteraceae bacterium]